MTDSRQEELPKIQSNRYTIISVLGSGGAGIVYKAIDTLLDKTVAIKKLHRTASRTESLRFQREAKLAATLNHPNVLTILDFGLTERHEPYMVLNYIEGQSLSSYLDLVESIKLEEALDIFIQIAEGLSHAHRKRVIHRDVTPNNIMLVDDGTRKIVQIVDFGLAKSTEEEQEVTKSGVGVGTPLYMSPEQIKGKSFDQRSDIYSFGCLMYRVLRGVPPFESDTVIGLIEMHLNQEALRLHVISPDKSQAFQIEELVARCLRKKPVDRYQTVDELLIDLTRAATPKEQFVEPVPKHIQREYYLLAIVSIVFLGCAGSLIFKIQSDKNVSEPPREPIHIVKYVEVKGKELGSLDEIINNTGTPDEARRDERNNRTYKTSESFIPNDHDIAEFARAHPDAKTFHLINGISVTSEGLAALEKLPLTNLTIKRCPLSKSGFQHIAALKKLTRLKLIDVANLDVDGLVALRKMPTLKELAIMDCNVDDERFEVLSKFDKLTRFELKYCSGLKTVDLGRLSEFKNLDTLIIINTGDAITGFDKIINLPIETLDLSASTITPANLTEIASIRTLRTFNLDFPPPTITPAMIDEFKRRRPDVEVESKLRVGMPNLLK